MSDKTVEAQSLVLDIEKLLNRVLYAVIHQKLKGYVFSRRIFRLIQSFLINRIMNAVFNWNASNSYYINVDAR